MFGALHETRFWTTRNFVFFLLSVTFRIKHGHGFPSEVIWGPLTTERVGKQENQQNPQQNPLNTEADWAKFLKIPGMLQFSGFQNNNEIKF